MLDQAGELTNKRTTRAMAKNVYNTDKAMSSVQSKKKDVTIQIWKAFLVQST